jgi:hypothetical protein
MSGVPIDEHGNGAAFHNVNAPTLQRESVVREVVYRERKCEFAAEPSLHGLFIVGTDANELAWLQRVHMRIDNFLGKFGLIVVGAKHGIRSPPRDCEKKECGCRCQPAPKKGLGQRSRGCDGMKIGANLFPERGRRGRIELRELQLPT